MAEITTTPEEAAVPGGEEETVHHESRAKRALDPAKMNLNLTAMIDIIFQLQIYFILTMSVAVNEGIISAKLPQAGTSSAAKSEPPPNPIKIIVASNGTYNYNISIEGFATSTPDFTSLKDQLAQMQFDPSRGLNGAYKPDNPVIIQPDGNVRWQHVVNAFNAAVGARYSAVSFASPSAPGDGG